MDYIKFKGEDYPFWYSIKANREMMKRDINEVDETYLIFLGMKYGAVNEKKKFELSESEVLDHFEINLDEFKIACAMLEEQSGKFREARGVKVNL